MPKISGLPEDTAPTTDDYSVSLDNGTTTLKKSKWLNVISMIAQNIMLSMYNPYKFYVYQNGTFSSPSGTIAKLPFDTKVYDISNNVDVGTNQGRFTAPITGNYHFTARTSTNITGRVFIAFYKNGSEILRGTDLASSGAPTGGFISGSIQLNASDYVEVYLFSASSGSYENGVIRTWFQGALREIN